MTRESIAREIFKDYIEKVKKEAYEKGYSEASDKWRKEWADTINNIKGAE